MQAYDNLGMENFYLGNIERAKFYQDRMLRGKLEDKESVVRNVCHNVLITKRERVKLK